MSRQTTEDFVERLVTALPALRPEYEQIYRECREDGLTEAAPEVFLDEQTRALRYRFRDGVIEARAELEALAAVIDERRDWRAAPGAVAFVDRVTAAVPALLRLAAENEYGDRGDVLVHGFLGDVAFRELDNYRSGGPVAMEEVRTVVALLETELGADRGVDEAIAVSFVENLPYPGEPGADLVDLLGPQLRAELQRQRPESPAG